MNENKTNINCLAYNMLTHFILIKLIINIIWYLVLIVKLLKKESKMEHMRNLKIKGIYKHYKGDLYIVEDIIYHSETGEKMVAYRALYGDNRLWCRPYNMFLDEVNKNGQKYRFTLQKIKSVKE